MEDDVMTFLMAVLALAALVMVLWLAYLLGYGVGLYSVPCAVDSSQPHCVKAGWGTAVRVTKP